MAGATELPCLPSPRSSVQRHPHWRRRRVCDLELVTWGKADGARHLHRRPTVVKLDKEGLSAADALGHLKENTIRFPPNSSSSSSPSSSSSSSAPRTTATTATTTASVSCVYFIQGGVPSLAPRTPRPVPPPRPPWVRPGFLPLTLPPLLPFALPPLSRRITRTARTALPDVPSLHPLEHPPVIELHYIRPVAVRRLDHRRDAPAAREWRHLHARAGDQGVRGGGETP